MLEIEMHLYEQFFFLSFDAVMSLEKYLESVYYDAKHPGSFGGLDKLYRAVRKEEKYVLSRTKIKKRLLYTDRLTRNSNARE